MQLKITNIGKIADADITIDGITVIAGANDTGKSTVGKVLFSFFNSLYDIENRIKKERKNLLYKILSIDVFPEREEPLFAEEGFVITSSAKKIA